MFYCNKCRVENDWPISANLSYGNCEVCSTTDNCFDVPSKDLNKHKQ